MTKQLLRPDICVIGAGSGGLSVAAGAAAFGVDVVLVEKGLMGGDCLNFGCVPSKAVLSAAKSVLAENGLRQTVDPADFDRARARLETAIQTIAPHDSVERFEGLGVTVLQGSARFLGPDRVAVGETVIQARRFVVATGSSPRIPDLPGLDQVPYLTNESLFEDFGPKDHLIILGGGPIGLEMAQAHRRLGSRVTVLEAGHILARDLPEHVDTLRRQLQAEGIALFEGVKVLRVASDQASVADSVAVEVETDEGLQTISGSHLLVATGRLPNTGGLDLEAAGIAFDGRGISVDRSLRTSNRRVYAIGDVIDGPKFTHAAGTQAGLVLRACLFRLPIRFAAASIPWVTYTSPEIAHVGLTLEQARKEHGNRVKVLSADFAQNDRAVAEALTVGRLQLYAGPGGRLLGADLIGTQAGELAALLSLAWSRKMKMKDLVGFVAPYPTLSELVRRAALSYYAEAPKSRPLRRLLAVLRLFG